MNDVWERTALEWEAFQETYIPHRREQFTALLGGVREGLGRAPVTVLDLGGGTGALARAAAEAFPSALVTVLDVDPLLLEIGLRADTDGRLRWVRADLRDPDWLRALDEGPFDAVVSATAMHWLAPDVLRRVYRQVRRLLGPGGMLANADIVPPGAGPRDGTVALERTLRRQTAQVGVTGLSWHRFWRDVEDTPAFSPLLAQRAHCLGLRPARVFLRAEEQVYALRSAGFVGIAEVWREDAHAVIVATAP